VTTEVYKHDYSPNDDPQEEHRALVEALVKAFRCESNMVYIKGGDTSKTPITINGTQADKPTGGTSYPPQVSDNFVCVSDTYKMASDYTTSADDSPLFPISVKVNYHEGKLEVEELKSPFSSNPFTYPYVPYTDAQLARTDARFRRTLEGYEESDTEDIRGKYNYVEFVHEDERVYRIRETSTVTITVNPSNKKVYTHVKMKNGAYAIRTFFANVNESIIESLTYGHVTGESLKGVSLHDISIDVVGSMYDDIR
jgi:hypothetical protein